MGIMSPDSHRADSDTVGLISEHTTSTMEDTMESKQPTTTSFPIRHLASALDSELEAVSKSTSSLAEAINSATHTLHSTLNLSITQAMPHGLPPEAHTPALYAHGLAVFVGTVYQTFEAEWTRLEEAQQHEDRARPQDTPDESHKKHQRQLRQYLAHMRPAGIERTPRIQKDLLALGVDPARRPNKNTVEARYEAHIKHQTSSKPHLLLSYAWCMYMAIFAGGRYVRQALSEVPDSFWEAAGQNERISNPPSEDTDENEGSCSAHPSSKLDRPGYSFLSFDGEDDGASIADAFRSNFAHADNILDASERCEVVQESRKVFEYCIALVQELNDGVAPIASDNPTMTYEDAERVVDQEKRMLMQALQMGDPEEQLTDRGQRAAKSRIFLLKAVAFGILWTLFFGTLVNWLTDKTPKGH